MATKVKERIEITLKDMHNPEIENMIEELKKYKNIKKQAEQMIEQLENAIKADMVANDVTEAAYGPHKCMLSEYNKTTFNKDIVKQEAPELFEKCTNIMTYTRFTVK